MKKHEMSRGERIEAFKGSMRDYPSWWMMRLCAVNLVKDNALMVIADPNGQYSMWDAKFIIELWNSIHPNMKFAA